MHTNSYIADILSEQLDADQVGLALQSANDREVSLFETMAENGHLKSDLLTIIAAHCGMETVILSTTNPSPDAAQLIPAHIAFRYHVVPLYKTDTTLILAFGNPIDIETLDTLCYLFQDPIEVLAALPEEIDAAQKRLYPSEYIANQSLFSPTDTTFSDLIPDERETEQPEINPRTDAPVIRFVNYLIREAFQQRASDIHLEPLNQQFRIRYRIDGVLHETEGPSPQLHPAVISRIKIMSKMKISEKRLPQDGRITLRSQGRELDLRVSAIPTNQGESIVMRILDKQSLTLGLTHLGFFADDHQAFEQAVHIANGMVLAAGPTGSGKTTTLYACLNHLNQPHRKIITVEDPVEYQLNGINQTQVNPQIGLTFCTALRAILRQAPNLIMIGEIRDTETAEIAINAALTGHLVLSTLHTNDAPGAVTRLIDMGIKPFLVSSALRSVLAQRLIRTICPHCKTETPSSASERQLLQAAGFPTNHLQLYKGSGCSACHQTGFRGRAGLFELLNIDDNVQQMIYAGLSSDALRNQVQKSGMRTLRSDGMRKAAAGMTTPDEVLRVTLREDG